MSENLDDFEISDKEAEKIKIRIAQNSDGKIIEHLVKSSGFDIKDIDWNDVYPYWLVADLNGEVIGCIQTCISKPIGRLEMLAVIEDLNPVLRSIVVKSLLYAGGATLKAAGAQIAMSMIEFGSQSFKKLLKRRGCVVVGQGNMIAKRL